MKTITNDTFKKEVLESSKIVLVDVWAPWCPPCRAMNPVVEEISKEIESWAEVAKIDASAEPNLVQALGVSSLPTFMVFKDGKVITSTIGATSKANLLDLVNKAK